MPILQLFVLIEEVFATHIFNLFLVLVNLHYFLFLFFFRSVLIYLLHIGNFLRRRHLIQFSMFSQLIHHLKHVVLQTQSCVPLAIKVNLDDHTFLIEVDPANVALLNIDLVV